MTNKPTAQRAYEKPQFIRSFTLAQVTATAPVSGAKVASDRRLKTDVQPLHVTENGIRLYAYRYVWSSEMQVGVMAQDLLDHPEFAAAVSLSEGGFYVVDYAALGLDLPVALAQWQAEAATLARHSYRRPEFGHSISLSAVTAQAAVSGAAAG